MKKKMFLSVALIALMAVGAFAQTTGTTPDGFAWSKTSDGKGINIVRYTGAATAVRIPDKIENLPVVTIGSQAFSSTYNGVNKNITSVVIPNTVTHIRNRAFYCQNKLTLISFPAESLVEIEFQAFIGCEALTTIDLPYPMQIIGDSAFEACYALTTITLPPYAKIGDQAFASCIALTTVNISAANRVTWGEDVFKGSTKVNEASRTALQRAYYRGAF
jgi:hypothetical protein